MNRLLESLESEAVKIGVDPEVLRYGMLVEGMFCVDVVLALLACCIFGKLMEGIVFISVFTFLRVYAGGAHCRTIPGCTAAYVIMVLLGVMTQDILSSLYEPLLVFLACMYMWIVCPVENNENPLTNEERKQDARVVKLRILICTLLYLSLYCMHIQMYRSVGAAMIALTILCGIQHYMNRRDL